MKEIRLNLRWFVLGTWQLSKQAVKIKVVPECLQLVPLLQFPQFPLDFVEEVGALEAAAVAVEADDDGAEAADQNRGPVHPELLRYHLPAGRTVPVGEYRRNENRWNEWIKMKN